MSYVHGIKISEVPTSLLPAAEVDSAIPFVVGCAPINQVDESNVNKPVLCYSYDEAVKAFGFQPAVEAEDGFKRYAYNLSEVMYSEFALFAVSPIVMVNVLDPKRHKKSASTTVIKVNANSGTAVIEEIGVIKSSLELKYSGVAYVEGTDYTVSFEDNGYCLISSLTDEYGNYKLSLQDINVTAEVLDPSMVTSADIIGGVDTEGNKKGFELLADVFPQFRVVPSILATPGYSSDPEVAAVMSAKADDINGCFRAICLVDVPTGTVKNYTNVAAWKNNNNIVKVNQICCWPMLNMSGTLYNYTSQLLALLAKVDSTNDGIPYVSPSNKNLECTGIALKDGTEINLDLDKGSYLNGNGIVTAQNLFAGWKCWGNRTAAYPDNTDVKDSFIPLRRMFIFIGVQLLRTFWQRLDYPLNRRQIDTILDSANIMLNGYASRQYILGGRVEFREDENTTTNLMDGKAVFHVYITPPSPNREIDFVLEYDTSYISTLFG